MLQHATETMYLTFTLIVYSYNLSSNLHSNNIYEYNKSSLDNKIVDMDIDILKE